MAASFAGLVWATLCLLAPLAVPIGWVLDRAVPHDCEMLSRNEVRALVAVHREIAREDGRAEPFNNDEEAMIKGALSLSTLTAETAGILKPVRKDFAWWSDP